VDFRRVNLLDENKLEKVGEVDIVFCRNVLIYFDTKAINKVINSLYKVLRAGGYLFLGHAETITGMNTGLRQYIHLRHFIIGKEKGIDAAVWSISGG